MTTETDDDLGPFDLDDMPGIPPLVRNARVAADLLFVDPPGIYEVQVTPSRVRLQGRESEGLPEWCNRHGLFERVDILTQWRSWVGHIEGVAVRVDVEVGR